MNQYIRPKAHAPLKGWRVITLPAFLNEPEITALVVEELAAELERLVERSRVREARTLFSWMDDSERESAS